MNRRKKTRMSKSENFVFRLVKRKQTVKGDSFRKRTVTTVSCSFRFLVEPCVRFIKVFR